MKTRLNRRLSAVKSLAPIYTSLRIPSSGAYDFVCRGCGEKLTPEAEVFELLAKVIRDFSGRDQAVTVTELLDSRIKQPGDDDEERS